MGSETISTARQPRMSPPHVLVVLQPRIYNLRLWGRRWIWDICWRFWLLPTMNRSRRPWTRPVNTQAGNRSWTWAQTSPAWCTNSSCFLPVQCLACAETRSLLIQCPAGAEQAGKKKRYLKKNQTLMFLFSFFFSQKIVFFSATKNRPWPRRRRCVAARRKIKRKTKNQSNIRVLSQAPCLRLIYCSKFPGE